SRFVPTGLLAGPEGEDYVNTMQQRGQEVPEDLKKQRLKYRVHVKLLGAVRVQGDKIIFVPSQRRLPHLGAKVAAPSAKVLQELCNLSGGSTELGDYVLGEFVFCGRGKTLPNPALRATEPALTVRFNIANLCGRRTVVFARSRYGKSNLIKLLISELYRTPPKTKHGKDIGTLIFDPEGEYFWPDRVDLRPGLCDVPQLQDKVVVFTNRVVPSPYYGSWKAGNIKLDIRDLPPRDVIDIAVSPERQGQQNILKLKGMNQEAWSQLVDLMAARELRVDIAEVGQLMGYSPEQANAKEAEIGAAISNMYTLIRTLHDPNSRVLDGTIDALSKGSVVIIDISLVSSAVGNMLMSLILRRIFSHNQEHFTSGSAALPAIAVLEEAQSVLGRSLDGGSPIVEWVKEGGKYELGAVLITQQPGALATDVISQADNWFSFHLLSEIDANTLGKHNSHFSDDILSHLIGEPIPGNCFMWSAPHQPFVLPVRIRLFEEGYRENIKTDPQAPAVGKTRAQTIREEVARTFEDTVGRLKEALRANNVKFVRLPPIQPGGKDLVGVWSSQLFHLVRTSKGPEDLRSENELKRPLMELVLGESNLHVLPLKGREYYAAELDVWEKVLDKTLVLSEVTD
ncbi:MAG: ATP-binding protein, partial [Nitrososphaerota archaeon]|nr:ATP-binding protein [Nitrososphaerota archaeon]